MGLGHSPRIVTDGLVLALDAGNPKNYNAGISTNWMDKVGGNNGTLVGGTHHNDGPFVGAGYVEFDGDSDSLTVTASTDFTLDGEFTVEFWIYLNTIVLDTQYPSPITFSQSGGNTGQIYLNSSNKFFGLYNGGSDVVTTGNNSVTTGRWYHVAATRDSSNNCRIFLDGVLKDTASSTHTFGNASGDLRIGSFNGTGGDVNGYISNLRIVKGTALYTSNFTPPTAPLTAVTNTTLLTCQGNSISPGTDIVVTTSNKGSGSVGSLSAVTSSGNYYFDNRSASPSTASIQLDFKTVQTGVTQIKLSGGSYALGSTFDLYVNGVLVEDDRSVVSAWGEDTITISSTNISSIKIEGSDGYSLGALKFNGTLVSGTIAEIVPNGDISLTKEPFGGAGAVDFGGSADGLYTPNITLGSNDWTLEFWIYLTSTGTARGLYSYMLNDTSSRQISYSINSSNQFGWQHRLNNGTYPSAAGSTALSAHTWYHVAAVRVNDDYYTYINGVQDSSYTSAPAGHTYYADGVPHYIGYNRIGTSDFDGLLSNVRLVVGKALYTENFTPPSRTLEPIENTVLLTCQGQNIKDYSSSAHTITPNGNVKATIVSSAFEFDGTDDYIDCGTSTDFDFGTDNYTIEAWIYINDGVQQYHGIFGSSGTGSDSLQFQLQDEKIRLSSYTAEILVSDAADVVPFRQWTHVVISRSGTGATDTKLYKNGSLIKSGQDNINWGSYGRQIGRVFSNNAYDLYGKIAQVKVYKGKGLTAEEVQQNYNALKGRYV